METRKRLKRYMSLSPMICCICGDDARGYNFNAITCMSCKSFFSRNAHRKSLIPRCQFNNHCIITKSTRSYCTGCRLEKCFAEKMEPKMIRSVPKSQSREQKSAANSMLQLSMPFTLDLLRNDRSTLTSEQWNLISNIIHIYDEQTSLVRIKHLVNRMDSLPPKLRAKPAETSNIISQFFSGVQPLIERSPDLHSLPIEARRALIRYNMYTTGALNGLFIFRELELNKNSTIMTAFSGIYHNDLTMICARISEQCDPNGNLIKIFLFLLAFSSNCSFVKFDDQEDIRTMSTSIDRIQIQNIYVTAFWKYLIYLYGFDQAVLRFSSMIQRILNLLYVAEAISNNTIHNQMLDAVVTKTERSLIIQN